MKQDGAEDSARAPQVPNGGPHDECRQIADKLLSDWQRGAHADVAAALAQHPELAHQKSIVRDLAYEEYCQRTERGEAVDIEQFAEQFSDCRTSLLRQLELHQLLDDCPELPDRWLETVWPKLGDEFLGFRIRESLGKGAFARVFLATEPALGNRQVAVKVSASGLEEADILGKLDHDHIVPIHSVQFDPNTALSAICMPYMGRATLVDVLDRISADKQVPESSQIFGTAIASTETDRQPAPRSNKGWRGSGNYVDAVMTIGMQLADALAEAHRQGIYHLDLKPSNVLLTDACRPMLLDFNLAHDQQQLIARQGGTLPYMAPEQFAMFRPTSADPPQSDLARADIYSLGVVLYELLTGRLPFPVPATANTNERVMAAIVELQRMGVTPIRSLNSRVPESLAALVEKCLATNPLARFASAGELATAIRAEYGIAKRTIRWAGRNRKLVAATVALLVTASIIGAAYTRHWRDTYYLRQIALGEDFHRQGNYGEAVKAFDRAYEDHPSAIEILLRRAEARMAQGDFAHAGLDLQEFLNQHKDGNVLVLAAYCSQRAGSHLRAARLYRDAIDLGVDTTLVRNNLGYSYERIGDYPEAKKHLSRAIEVDPKNQAAHHNLALVEMRLAEYSRQVPTSAMKLIEHALGLGSPEAELYRTSAVIYSNAAKLDNAYENAAIDHVNRAIAAGVSRESLALHSQILPLLDSVPKIVATRNVAPSTDKSSGRILAPLDRPTTIPSMEAIAAEGPR